MKPATGITRFVTPQAGLVLLMLDLAGIAFNAWIESIGGVAVGVVAGVILAVDVDARYRAEKDAAVQKWHSRWHDEHGVRKHMERELYVVGERGEGE